MSRPPAVAEPGPRRGVTEAGDRPAADAWPPGPFGRAVLVASGVALAGAFLWPQAAELLLRVLIAGVATAFVAVRAWEAGLPEATTFDAFSPFEGEPVVPEWSAPPAVLRLADELTAADAGRRAERETVPWSVRRGLVAEGARRLAERHGLRLGDPGHHGRIRGLVSATTWSFLRPHDPSDGPPAAADVHPLTVRGLDPVLDDLEKL